MKRRGWSSRLVRPGQLLDMEVVFGSDLNTISAILSRGSLVKQTSCPMMVLRSIHCPVLSGRRLIRSFSRCDDLSTGCPGVITVGDFLVFLDVGL